MSADALEAIMGRPCRCGRTMVHACGLHTIDELGCHGVGFCQLRIWVGPVQCARLCQEYKYRPGLDMRRGPNRAQRWQCKTTKERTWERGSLSQPWTVCLSLREENRRVHRAG